MTKTFYRGAACVLLCFSLDNEESFRAVQATWAPSVKQAIGGPFVPVLVGLKSDTFHVVSRAEGEKAARQLGGPYFEATAKDDVGVNELFDSICRTLFESAVRSRMIQSPLDERPTESVKLDTARSAMPSVKKTFSSIKCVI